MDVLSYLFLMSTFYIQHIPDIFGLSAGQAATAS